MKNEKSPFLLITDVIDDRFIAAAADKPVSGIKRQRADARSRKTLLLAACLSLLLCAVAFAAGAMMKNSGLLGGISSHGSVAGVTTVPVADQATTVPYTSVDDLTTAPFRQEIVQPGGFEPELIVSDASGECRISYLSPGGGRVTTAAISLPEPVYNMGMPYFIRFADGTVKALLTGNKQPGNTAVLYLLSGGDSGPGFEITQLTRAVTGNDDGVSNICLFAFADKLNGYYAVTEPTTGELCYFVTADGGASWELAGCNKPGCTRHGYFTPGY